MLSFFNSLEFISLLTSGIIIYFLLPRCKDNTVEDIYQTERKLKFKDEGALIHVRMKYHNNEEGLEEVLSSLENRLRKYNYEYNKVQLTNRIDPNLIYIFENEDAFHFCFQYHYKFLIDVKNQVIQAKVKHEFIGGAYLLELFYCFLKNTQKSSNKLFPKSRWSNIIFVPSLVWFLNFKLPVITPLPLVSSDEQIERYKGSFTISNNSTCSSKTFVLYNILTTIYKALNLDRDLICYLPIAFQASEGIKNNIGLMWIIFNPYQSISEFASNIEKSKWQILASNACLHCLPSCFKSLGKNVRSAVDVVVSFMLGADDLDFEATWTFEHISDYPIYIAVASILKSNGDINITQTITSSTSVLTMKNLNKFGDFARVSKEEFCGLSRPHDDR